MTKPYRWLATYYDQFFGAFRTPMQVARKRILGPILARTESACDLASGSGITAIEFAKRGIRVTAVDLSPGMCRLVREKARKEQLPIRVIRADMRDFQLPQSVDLITCEFDALNHIPEPSDLVKVARCAAAALRPGGHFFFDVNNAKGFRAYWTGTLCVEQRGVMLLMRNGNDAASKRAWSDIDWFIKQGTQWTRYSERVEEVCWTNKEIRTALTQAGFDRIRAWDAAPFFGGGGSQSPITKGCRTIYLARKAPSATSSAPALRPEQ